MSCNRLVGLAVLLLVAVASACKGYGTEPTPAPQPVLTIGEANEFVDSLARALRSAAQTSQSRVAANLGVSPVNLTCEVTRSCNAGGTIRPSFTATGQISIGVNGVSWNSPMSGSQNILD